MYIMLGGNNDVQPARAMKYLSIANIYCYQFVGVIQPPDG